MLDSEFFFVFIMYRQFMCILPPPKDFWPSFVRRYMLVAGLYEARSSPKTMIATIYSVASSVQSITRRFEERTALDLFSTLFNCWFFFGYTIYAVFAGSVTIYVDAVWLMRMIDAVYLICAQC